MSFFLKDSDSGIRKRELLAWNYEYTVCIHCKQLT